MRIPVSTLVPGPGQRVADFEVSFPAPATASTHLDSVNINSPGGLHPVASGQIITDATSYNIPVQPGLESVQVLGPLTDATSMWTEASASYKERPSFAPQLTLIPLREEVADSQPEPMSWQLGGISSFSLMGDAPASEAKLPGLTVSLKEGTTFKVPNVVPVKKKRGRPPTNKTLDPTKTPSPRKAKVKQVARKNKTRKKRLTMARLGRPPGSIKKVPVRPAPVIPNGTPMNEVLSHEARSARMDILFESCPEELSRSLRAASVTVEGICKEVEDFKLGFLEGRQSIESIQFLQDKMTQECKERQNLEDHEDALMSQTLCEKVLAVQHTDSDAKSITPLFLNGPADDEIKEVRKLMHLPQIEKAPATEEVQNLTHGFFSSVGLPSDFAARDYTFDEFKEVCSSNWSDTSHSLNNNGSTVKIPGSVCDFSSRPHPRELSQQLYALLGKSALPKAEKRAAQRARRAAQSENMTEEHMERTCFDYLKNCANRPFLEIPVQTPQYHRVNRRCAEEPEAAVTEFQDNFVKPCSCRGGSRCGLCENLPVWKSHLPAATNVAVPSHAMVYEHCFACGVAYQLDFESAKMLHPRHKTDEGAPLPLESFLLWPDYLPMEDERDLLRFINARMWIDGESGCRRQDYGPTANYQRQRISLSKFSGLPHFTQSLIQKMLKWKELADFQCGGLSIVEMTKERESALQTRMEDEWMWGERVVILSLTADTLLTFSPTSWDRKDVYRPVRVGVPRRSLFVMAGEARRKWNYSVLSADVNEKQIMMVFRELGRVFRGDGGKADIGRRILKIAQEYKGKINAQSVGL